MYILSVGGKWKVERSSIEYSTVKLGVSAPTQVYINSFMFVHAHIFKSGISCSKLDGRAMGTKTITTVTATELDQDHNHTKLSMVSCSVHIASFYYLNGRAVWQLQSKYDISGAVVSDNKLIKGC